MINLLARLFIKGTDAADPRVRKAYATLSSLAGILLNLMLCAAKLAAGALSRSVSMAADGFNNLADAGMSLVSLLGFSIAQYGSGETHPFGHGRIEWIMSIFGSLLVILMGAKLAHTSIRAIAVPQGAQLTVSSAVILTLSVLVKLCMYGYNRRFAALTDSQLLKATAADCLSDAAATAAVLLCAVVSHMTGLVIDGFCGLAVSALIVVAGYKSLCSTLGRIMGRAPDAAILRDVLRTAGSLPGVAAVYDPMAHDYGFGCLVLSMRIAGNRRDADALYAAAHQLTHGQHGVFPCGCCVQVDYLVQDDALLAGVQRAIDHALLPYGGAVKTANLRLVENGTGVDAMLDLIYYSKLQKHEARIVSEIEAALHRLRPACRLIAKGTLMRERPALHRPQEDA